MTIRRKVMSLIRAILIGCVAALTKFERAMMFADVFKKFSDRVHIISCKDVDKNERNCVFSHKTNKYAAPLIYTVPFQFVAAKGAKDIGIDTAINPFDVPLAHYE